MPTQYHKIIAIIIEGKNWQIDNKRKGILLITEKNKWKGNRTMFQASNIHKEDKRQMYLI